ncbi:Radical SAM superfamily protein [Lacunisphaera limnophila]|uniref:Radical SAM superfamily protein n=1 Tax=Lacunisphaera limnophila TaxID=1838286 RepID=A0A1D8ATB9_9BACT|nr:PA0069 family radical SAM protein [Lacunisphaera limnophila]AOS44133.1 Radical SAM superfamily protein [Lacunisphaera limnophila]
MPPPAVPRPTPGRGTTLNPANRFERLTVEPDPDYAEYDEHGVPVERPHPRTQFYVDASESILVRHDSPDLGPGWGLNPYRGCEHGCAYCFARPFHDYLGWNSGVDFETKILVKPRAPDLLRAALSARSWHPEPISLSGITDCYQPAERKFQLTRRCLEVMTEFRQPVGIITKNFLVTRDIDLLAGLAAHDGAAVYVTLTTLDADLSGRLEPRAARPDHRLRAIRLLTDAGIPVGVMVAPVIPGLTEHEIPAILDAVAAAGARRAAYILLRLPHTVKDVFLAWLDTHAPAKKDRVLARLRDLHGGQLYDATFGTRLRGTGIFAEQTEQLFTVSARRAGLNRADFNLSTAAFRRPGGTQLDLL